MSLAWPSGCEATPALVAESWWLGRFVPVQKPERSRRRSHKVSLGVASARSPAIARRRSADAVSEPQQLASMLDGHRLLGVGLLAGGRLYLSNYKRYADRQIARQGVPTESVEKTSPTAAPVSCRNAWKPAPPSSARTGAPLWSRTRLRMAIRPVS